MADCGLAVVVGIGLLVLAGSGRGQAASDGRRPQTAVTAAANGVDVRRGATAVRGRLRRRRDGGGADGGGCGGDGGGGGGGGD